MCGRFTQSYTWRELVELYRLTQPVGRPHLVNAEAFDKRTITACRAPGYARSRPDNLLNMWPVSKQANVSGRGETMNRGGGG